MVSKSLLNKIKNTLDNSEVIVLLKEDLKGEYEAIGMYTAHIDTIKDKEIVSALTEIRNDEEDHAKKIKAIIAKLEGVKRSESKLISTIC